MPTSGRFTLRPKRESNVLLQNPVDPRYAYRKPAMLPPFFYLFQAGFLGCLLHEIHGSTEK